LQEITLKATIENIEQVTAFVDELLEANDCSMKANMQIDIAIDEIFGNIAHYAYGDSVGDATVKVEFIDEPHSVEITFVDSGVPYDPLKKDDPDVTLSADEREVGGLGIFMVKKSMDSMKYQYSDGYNILKISKKI